jgi:hypothetical protein
MAPAWIEADTVAVERAIVLVDDLARGDRSVAAELRQLEDRLGLTPLARRRLQWELDQATERVAAPPQPPRRDLRAVS